MASTTTASRTARTRGTRVISTKDKTFPNIAAIPTSSVPADTRAVPSGCSPISAHVYPE